MEVENSRMRGISYSKAWRPSCMINSLQRHTINHPNTLICSSFSFRFSRPELEFFTMRPVIPQVVDDDRYQQPLSTEVCIFHPIFVPNHEKQGVS